MNTVLDDNKKVTYLIRYSIPLVIIIFMGKAKTVFQKWCAPVNNSFPYQRPVEMLTLNFNSSTCKQRLGLLERISVLRN